MGIREFQLGNNYLRITTWEVSRQPDRALLFRIPSHKKLMPLQLSLKTRKTSDRVLHHRLIAICNFWPALIGEMPRIGPYGGTTFNSEEKVDSDNPSDRAALT